MPRDRQISHKKNNDDQLAPGQSIIFLIRILKKTFLGHLLLVMGEGVDNLVGVISRFAQKCQSLLGAK